MTVHVFIWYNNLTTTFCIVTTNKIKAWYKLHQVLIEHLTYNIFNETVYTHKLLINITYIKVHWFLINLILLSVLSSAITYTSKSDDIDNDFTRFQRIGFHVLSIDLFWRHKQQVVWGITVAYVFLWAFAFPQCEWGKRNWDDLIGSFCRFELWFTLFRFALHSTCNTRIVTNKISVLFHLLISFASLWFLSLTNILHLRCGLWCIPFPFSVFPCLCQQLL